MAFTISTGGGVPVAATLISPTGTITTTTPTYVWNAVSNASYYYLYNGTAATWYTASAAGCGSGTGTCSITGSALAAGSYTWYVQTYNSSGYGPWSSGMSFTISTGGGGFNEQFTSNPTNWSQDSGSWSWNSTGGLWYTAGTPELSSQSTYNATYTNFDYSAKLWRSGSTGSSNRLWVRASSSTISTGHALNGYIFQYSTDGWYSVFKNVNGVSTELKAWTSNSAIVTGAAWNTLRVYASGSSFWFYINGTLVWTGADSSHSSGRVGVGMYRDSTSTGNGFYVDWATLSIPAGAVTSDEQVSEAQLLLNQGVTGGRSADVNGVPN